MIDILYAHGKCRAYKNSKNYSKPVCAISDKTDVFPSRVHPAAEVLTTVLARVL